MQISPGVFAGRRCRVHLMQEEIGAEAEEHQRKEGLVLVGWTLANGVGKGCKQAAVYESLDGEPEEGAAKQNISIVL
jgi:hypothetical protein